MNGDYDARGKKAAVAYLVRKGMTVLDVDYKTSNGKIAIVAIDGEEVVHVTVKIHVDRIPMDNFHIPTKKEDALRELQIKEYMKDCELSGRPYRFDFINIRVLTDDRALLSHHTKRR